MAKFMIGDKVRIKTNLPKYESDKCVVTAAMVGMEGQVHIIEEIGRINHNYKIFTNSGDDFWWFSEEMLEPVISSFIIELDYDTMTSEAERISNQIASNLGITLKNFGRNFSSINTIKKTEEKKMPTTFTFYTEEGYRIDKSNNSKVETITTFVKINGSDNTYLGMATCDKVDYSEREGVINALANAMCNGNFDREFNKAVKDNARADKKARTCTYCGQLFDTVEEKQAHEAWHVERRKARHERYLLRKRAKEIAFEEAAQKLAKEIIAEDNKK